MGRGLGRVLFAMVLATGLGGASAAGRSAVTGIGAEVAGGVTSLAPAGVLEKVTEEGPGVGVVPSAPP